MAHPNRINNVAMIGAGGNSGSYMAEALINGGKHTVTALTREGSQSELPEGVLMKTINYAKPETLVEALKGQDVLVMSLSTQTPHEVDQQLFQAAGEAGVKWILPNEWSPDNADDAIRKDVPMFERKQTHRDAIQSLGKSNFIAVTTGFWYEWSLAIAPAYGFDMKNRSVTFFDDGATKISTSTWPQVGRAVAAILSLPIESEGGHAEACLQNLKNKIVYINSFTVSQQDMFASVLRVTGTKEDDWSITREPSHDRYTTGLKELKQGSRVGFAKVMYTRIFFPDGSGDFETRRGTMNKVLGLPVENIDEATARAIERSKLPSWSDS